jgi:predicted lysophospholipase L1 biosynthesis ABC-type transport system permease subunit
MRIRFDPSKLRQARWYEYALRFLFGGAISAIAAVISKKFGPQVGGLFLAFPAIFPAGATLIEKHEREKKERKGLHGKIRGRTAAGVDAAGAAMGACGLLVFAVLAWKLLPNHATWAVLAGTTLAWLGVSVSIWAACGKLRHFRRKFRPSQHYS